ncbi:hypothetical protein EG68_05918 [Paragonimus skrjabini miyazakii]|uniref:Ion transport domain-containing protein n=1 Tax=Paragonimus skrjabini miyazakii TaxID=59628 RepID=A0A8S9YDT9_9TREM|nr:hypothetical protein EG68_05918 [Paragonimus skrjabini miyazakii]
MLHSNTNEKMLNGTKKNVEFKGDLGKMPPVESDFAGDMKFAVRTGNFDLLISLTKENLHKDSEVVSGTDDLILDCLYQAIRMGDFNCIKVFFEHGEADANVWFRDNLTPLHLAAKYGIPFEEKAASEKFPDSDQVTEWRPPDIQGVVHNRIIHYLVAQGAYLECRDQNGMTALHHAVMRNNLNCVMQLISEGADLNCVDNADMTPLILAVRNSNTRIVQLLLQQNADATICDNRLCNVFHHACYHGNKKITDIIYKHLKHENDAEFAKEMLNSKNVKLETPLHLAILSKSFPATEYCLDSGADISAVTFQQETALHLAARSGNMNIVEELLKREVPVDELNSHMQTPLFYAIEGGHIYVVERLLSSDAYVDHSDIEGMSPLLLAAKKGFVDICQLLIEQDAQLYATNHEMESCLMLAVLGKHNDVVEFLLRSEECEDLLEMTDDKGDTPLHAAVRLGSIQMTKMLIDKGADVLTKNVQQHTALHVAAIHGRFGIVQLLLDHTPIIAHERDVDGNFAVHLAAKHGNLHVLKKLLSTAPHLNETNSAGQTPLCFAAEHNRLDCVRYLLDQGTDVNHRDNSNITPLFLACCGGHVDIVNELLKAGAKPGFRVHKNHPLYATWNALDVSVDSRKHLCAQAILNSDFWESVLHGVATAEPDEVNTSLRRMICDAPADAELALSRCVTKNTVPKQSKDFEVKFNFHPLENRTSLLMGSDYEDNSFIDVDTSGTFMESVIESTRKWKTKNTDLHPVLLMLKRGRESLLNHPLVIALISLKWARFFFIYYAYLLMYALFLALFTSFMLQTKAPYMIKLASAGPADTNTLCEKLQNTSAKAYHLHIGVPKYGTMVISVANLLVELFQMIVFKLDYISLDNFLELGIYSLALVTTLDFSRCMQTTGLRTVWQWATGIVGIFLAWINLLLYARRDSKLGIFVIMFLMVMKTFFKFIAVFSPFLIAFTLSFHMLLANHVPFSRVHFAFIKTFSMATGELDTSSIFFDQYGDANTENKVYYEVITYIVFVAFVTIMTIIMMNLLVGLAVDDIKEVRRKAAIIREEMKIDLIFSAESVLNHFRQFIGTPDEYVYRPNDCHGLMQHMFRYFYESAVRTVQEVSETDVAKKEEDGEDDTETRKKPEEVLQDLHQLTLHIGKLLNRLVDRVNEGGLAESRVNRPLVQGALRAGVLDTGPQPRSLTTTATLGDSRVPSRIERLHIDDDVDEEPFEFG